MKRRFAGDTTIGRPFNILFLSLTVLASISLAENATSSSSLTASSLPDPLAPCLNNQDCEARYGNASQCLENAQCSNPFAQGCLYRQLGSPKRVCNSDDPLNASQIGLCRVPDVQQMEIRIHIQDWESVTFEAWILQIVLSEMLSVPTTIETGTPLAKANFYDPHNSFQMGVAYDWDSLIRANTLEDCTLAHRNTTDPAQYESCAHVMPEMWRAGGPLDNRSDMVQQMVLTDQLAPPQTLGVLGQNSWYVPKFTAERNPTILSYVGLQGDDNRQKLASLFLRPTTWRDYCDEVSLDHCATDNGVAKRQPLDMTEGDRMFVPGLYTGHFRKTEKNDCDKHPTTCTGHIADYPCGWMSYLKQQLHWLDIALESDGPEPGCGGYTAQQLVDMWAAANATKSDLMMQWYYPDSLFQSFLGTDSEFTRVMLPPTTQECVSARVSPNERCSSNLLYQIGRAQGDCDQAPIAILKGQSKNLYRTLYQSSTPVGIRSPAYDVISLFSLTSLQIGDLFNSWKTYGSPREGVCKWVIENYQDVRDFVPRTYPRVLKEVDEKGPILYASTLVAGFVCLQVVWTAWMVFDQRHRKVIRMAQVEFLWLLLAGALIISVGAVLAGVSPSDHICVAEIWLIDIGYTLELVPLLVKVSAINKVMLAASQMRRAVVKRENLLGGVALIVAFVMVFLSVWTALDAPKRMPEYDLTDTLVGNNETLVLIDYYCSSGSSAWKFFSVGWTALLLLWASVLAFQSRNVRQEFNESQTLGMMTYSHFVFVMLQLITFFLSSTNVSQATLSRSRSLIYSLDTLAGICIYFVPKFLMKDEGRWPQLQAQSTNQNISSVVVSGLASSYQESSGVLTLQLKQLTNNSFSSAFEASNFEKRLSGTLSGRLVIRDPGELKDDDNTQCGNPSTLNDISPHVARTTTENTFFTLRHCRACGEAESEPLVLVRSGDLMTVQLDLDGIRLDDELAVI